MHDLSLEALQAKDKVSYKVFNKKATDLWGKLNFTMMMSSVGSVLPAFFALGWMQYRFQDVEFPLPFSLPVLGDVTVGYFTLFVLCYILNKIIFRNIKGRIEYFRYGQDLLAEAKRDYEAKRDFYQSVDFGDLSPKIDT